MSGPKTAHYTLTIEQRRILREQQERERKIKSMKAHIFICASELNLLCAEIKKMIDRVQVLNARTGYDIEHLKSINLIVQQAQTVINDNTNISEFNILQQHQKAIDDCLKNLKQISIVLKEEAIKMEQQLKNSLNESVDKGFLLSFEQTAKITAPSKVEEYLTGIINRLRGLLADNLSVALIDEVNAAIEKAKKIGSIEYLENFNAVVAAPLVKRCQQYITIYEQNSDYFNELVTRCQVLCDERVVAFAPPAFSIETLKGLEAKVSQMEFESEKQVEETYISEAIDGVMEEMGYTVLGCKDVVKRSGNQFHSELYSFDEGTAVNVTYSSDGKITMELGGLSDEDKLPSQNEAAKLCDNMKAFCGDFTAIEKKLEQRGIIVKDRVSILPPDAQYAQIINVSDYYMTEETEHFAVKRGKLQNKTINRLR